MNYAALFLHRVFLLSERRRRRRRAFTSPLPGFFLPSNLPTSPSFVRVIFRLRMPKAARKTEKKKQMHVSEIKPFPADTDVGQESVATVHLYPLDNLRWDRGKESWYEEKYKIHLYDTLDYCTLNPNSVFK